MLSSVRAARSAAMVYVRRDVAGYCELRDSIGFNRFPFV
jgi:hypothetical protein